MRRVAALCLLGAALFGASPVLADPVGECQAVTNIQVETTQCLMDTLGATQQVMELQLGEARERADSLDLVTGRAVARPALDESQEAWEAFRDVNCAVRSAFAGGASGAGQFETGCAISMTRVRAEELLALGR
jgi:uncharacterized protein YecT (DUF1311 family)